MSTNAVISRACQLAGGLRALASKIGVTAPTIHQWISGARPIPSERCTAIERATDEAVILGVDGVGQLAHAMADTVVVKDDAGLVTYVKDTDYTVSNATLGRIKRIPGGAIAAGAHLKLSYGYLDPSLVTKADIIGGIDTLGSRIGLEALRDTYQEFGFAPKLLLAPGYSPLQSVATAMIGMADALGAMALIDAPAGATRDQVVASRGPSGPFLWNTASERALLCYPYMKVGGDTPADYRPLSPYAAGTICGKDYLQGFWWSPSNTEINGLVATERKLSARYDDPACDVNLLNEAGITTVFNAFGSGLRLWGNRSAAWPSETLMTQFVPVRRTADIINESIRYFGAQFVDRPLTNATIDAVVESVNGYLRKLEGDGASLGGLCWFDPAKNSPDITGAGQIVVSYKFTPPPPMERLTFQAEVTDDFLLRLLPAALRG